MLSMTQSTESKEKNEIWGKRMSPQGWDLAQNSSSTERGTLFS